MRIDPELLAMIRCPVSGLPLIENDGRLVTAEGRSYPIVRGIPCLMPEKLAPTHLGAIDMMAQNARFIAEPPEISDVYLRSFMQGMLVPTCGNLFRGVEIEGRYPIPTLPEAAVRSPILEIGCSWSRWSIAATTAGHHVIGLDAHLEGLLCAQRLFRDHLGKEPHLVLADARALPFGDQSFRGIISYSVVQHFSRETAALILREAGRVLHRGATSVVQMPNVGGPRCFTNALRRGFTDGDEFDVRFYTIDQLLRLFSDSIGPSSWHVDCFLGLNVHAADKALLPAARHWIVDLAERLRVIAQRQRWLARHADSVWITSVRL